MSKTPKSKPGTVLRDLRKHHLLVTQEELAAACELHKRTINRVEFCDKVRPTTQFAIVRGLNALLSEMHGQPIRLATTDVFENNRAIPGVDRDARLDVRVAQRRDFVDRLLQQRLLKPLI
jgi:DNA-binding XRE family transcriptional regulator